MAARWFVIPMQKPVDPSGFGTRDDPWRPKYLREAGLGFTDGANFRYWMICRVTYGSDDIYDPAGEALLDTLAARPDVHEIRANTAIPAGKRAALQNWLTKRGVTDANLDLQGIALVNELKRICLQVQRAETQAERDAIRAELMAA